MRAEGAEVAQTADRVDASRPHIAQRCLQGKVVVVDAPEDGDALHRFPRSLGRTERVTSLYCAGAEDRVQGKRPEVRRPLLPLPPRKGHREGAGEVAGEGI